MMGDEKRGDFDFGIARERFKNWAANVKQCISTIEEAVIEASNVAYFSLCESMGTGAVCDVIIREFCATFSIPQPSPQSQFLSLCGGYRPLVESFLARGPLEKANNIAYMKACNASISFVMKKITGEEDVHTSMVAGFGYGVMISLVTGMRGPDIMSVGVMCALFNGGLFKARAHKRRDASSPKMNRVTITKTRGSSEER